MTAHTVHKYLHRQLLSSTFLKIVCVYVYAYVYIGGGHQSGSIRPFEGVSSDDQNVGYAGRILSAHFEHFPG